MMQSEMFGDSIERRQSRPGTTSLTMGLNGE